jgi:hypothetical protein
VTEFFDCKDLILIIVEMTQAPRGVSTIDAITTYTYLYFDSFQFSAASENMIPVSAKPEVIAKYRKIG